MEALLIYLDNSTNNNNWPATDAPPLPPTLSDN